MNVGELSEELMRRLRRDTSLSEAELRRLFVATPEWLTMMRNRDVELTDEEVDQIYEIVLLLQSGQLDRDFLKPFERDHEKYLREEFERN